jgi:flagellar basal-body rod modification protein FlgD
MPSMGKPQFAKAHNTFSNISMKETKDRGKLLNKLSGFKEKSLFVDRSKHNKMGKDGFLKLLANQLQNQDPTNPMDQKKFAADLAQFSQLEQLTNLNSKFEKLSNNDALEMKSLAASFLGKEVTTKGTTINLKNDGDSASIPFILEKNASKAMIRIFDQKNNLIGQIDTQALNKGSHRFTWDGVSLDGTPAVKGEYRIEVRGWDNQMEQFLGETKSTGLVTDVTFENGETVLKLDGQKSVSLRDVENFSIPVNNNIKAGRANNQMMKSAAKQYSQAAKEM